MKMNKGEFGKRSKGSLGRECERRGGEERTSGGQGRVLTGRSSGESDNRLHVSREEAALRLLRRHRRKQSQGP